MSRKAFTSNNLTEQLKLPTGVYTSPGTPQVSLCLFDSAEALCWTLKAQAGIPFVLISTNVAQWTAKEIPFPALQVGGESWVIRNHYVWKGHRWTSYILRSMHRLWPCNGLGQNTTNIYMYSLLRYASTWVCICHVSRVPILFPSKLPQLDPWPQWLPMHSSCTCQMEYHPVNMAKSHEIRWNREPRWNIQETSIKKNGLYSHGPKQPCDLLC